MPRPRAPIDETKLIELREQGWSFERIARKIGGGSTGTLRRRHAELEGQRLAALERVSSLVSEVRSDGSRSADV